MAFDRTNLERVAGGKQKLFIYTTTDAIATVTGSDYFDGQENEFDKGDIIIVFGSSGGTPTVDVVAVTSARGVTTTTTTATEGVTAT